MEEGTRITQVPEFKTPKRREGSTDHDNLDRMLSLKGLDGKSYGRSNSFSTYGGLENGNEYAYGCGSSLPLLQKGEEVHEMITLSWGDVYIYLMDAYYETYFNKADPKRGAGDRDPTGRERVYLCLLNHCQFVFPIEHLAKDTIPRLASSMAGQGDPFPKRRSDLLIECDSFVERCMLLIANEPIRRACRGKKVVGIADLRSKPPSRDRKGVEQSSDIIVCIEDVYRSLIKLDT